VKLTESAQEIPPKKRLRLLQWLGRRKIRRYGLSLGSLVLILVLIAQSGVQQPISGILRMTSVLVCAWLAGPGPALWMPALLVIVGRLDGVASDRWDIFTSQQLVELLVLTLLSASVGLAGQYQRRVRAVTAESRQKLLNQARAIRHAHIVFRDMNGRIIDWNDGAQQLFGWTKEEVAHGSLHQVLKTQFPQSIPAILHRLMQAGQWEGELIQHRKDGDALHISAHWILYRNEHGTAIGIAEVYNDVSDLRRAESAIREADRRKDEFLAMLAHELRNPLAPIRTGLELMKLSLDDPEVLRQTRAIMERQTQQLVTLVDDLLDVSRITRGKLDLRLKHVSLQDVLHHAAETSRPFLEEAHHQFRMAISKERIMLLADPHRLAQVLSNLLNNAAKYTPEGGRIELVAEQVANEVRITVKDSGVGIPPEKLEQIFEIFTQGDQPAGRLRSGLGIGLTLARSLVVLHGGRLTAHSAGPDLGSEFCVSLPVAVNPAEPETPRRSPVSSFAPVASRVLVVDDNRAAVETLSKMIRLFGSEVRMAYDGLEAVEAAKEFVPDVILMDLGMPRLDGCEAARRIRQLDRGDEILLVALTGWGQASDRQKTRDAGFDRHIVKPADPEQLRLLIRQQRSASALADPDPGNHPHASEESSHAP
jgi:PAS domain S-box-containing protein